MEEPVADPVAGSIEKELSSFGGGAFVLTWIWGIGNGVWILFLALIPVAGIVMGFILGFKGRKWSRNTGKRGYFELSSGSISFITEREVG